ncbi:MAG: hypothetical protein V9G04_03520 [Nocardioides sp.]|jgi:hypothetical protein
MHRRTARRLTPVLAVVAVLGAGCSSDESPEPAQTTTAATPTDDATTQETAATENESAQGVRIDITIEGSKVSPGAGERIQVPVDEPFTLHVTSDAADELHVHSSPEQSFEVAPGEQTFELTIERPGIVEIELHELGVPVVSLEVR